MVSRKKKHKYKVNTITNPLEKYSNVKRISAITDSIKTIDQWIILQHNMETFTLRSEVLSRVFFKVVLSLVYLDEIARGMYEIVIVK